MAYQIVLFKWVLLIFVLEQGHGCDEGWEQSNGNCYKIFIEPESKTVAESTCFDMRSALASVSTAEEHSFLATELSQINSTEDKFWVGLHKIDADTVWNNRASANVPWVDDSTLQGSWDCFVFNGAKVLPEDCTTKAGFVCEQWKEVEHSPLLSCHPGAHRDWLSGKCFWYTHFRLSKAGSEVVCSLKYGRLIIMRGVLFPINIAMILTLTPPESPIVLWTSLIANNGSFVFEDGEVFSHEDFSYQYGEGDCVALEVEAGKQFRLAQRPCSDEAFGFCENTISEATGFLDMFTATDTEVTSPGATMFCPPGYNWQEHEETGFCYWETSYETDRLSWVDAQKYCESYGGSLASFHSTTEERIGLGFQFGSVEHSYWIGMHYDIDKDEYVWIDGSPVDYENWDEGQPNHANRRKRCAFMNSVKKRWSLSYCGVLTWFICKAPKQVNPPSPVPPTIEPLIPCSTEYAEEYFYNGYCYERFSDLRSWHGSAESCLSKGRYLVSVHSTNENDFLIRLLYKARARNGNRVWIGLNSLGASGAFNWADSSTVDFTNWDEKEPNNFQNQEMCVNMYTGHGMWNDENCNTVMNYICKRINGTTDRGPITTTVVPVEGNCKKDWYRFGDKCYLPVGDRQTQRKNWTEAGLYCISQGGYLASVKNKKEQAFLYYLMQNLKMDTWIGLHDAIHAGVYYWIDNSELSYVNWERGEPLSMGSKENCVKINYGKLPAGRWADDTCDKVLPFICQGHPDPAIETPYAVRGTKCVTNSEYLKHGSSCYKIFTAATTAADAEGTCQQDQGHLVSIRSNDTLAVTSYLAANHLMDNETFWIGLTSNDDNNLRWVSGWPMSFSLWAENQPRNIKNECFYSSVTGFWKGGPCTEKRAFICHIDAEKPATGPPPATTNCSLSSLYSWFDGGQACYTMSLRRFTGDTASLLCKIRDGNLASIHSMKTLDELQVRFKLIHGSVTIGLKRTELGGFEWMDGSPVDFVNWDVDEPGETGGCVQMDTDSLKWAVTSCDVYRKFLCSKNKEILPDENRTADRIKGEITDNSQSSLAPGAVAAICIVILLLVGAAVVILYRVRPWEKAWRRFSSAMEPPVTSFENVIYSDEHFNVDFHDRRVLYENK